MRIISRVLALILLGLALVGIAFGQSSSSVSLAASSNPSTYGSSVTFTATVTPSAATGTLTFMDGSTVLGTRNVIGGSAPYSTSTLAAGTHSITAVYSGDANYNSSTSSTLTQTVNTANATVTVSSSSNPSTYGSVVTFTAAVTPSAATGTVTFMDGSAVLGTGNISDGNAWYSASVLPAGSHSITAVYAGDANDNGSTSSPLTQTVNPANATVVVASSANPSTHGAAVTFTATVTPSTATGTVTFMDGSTAMGTGSAIGGTATYSISTLAVGTHSITAAYAGDTNDNGTVSSILTQTVTTLPTGWADTDVGAVGSQTGSAAFSGGTFTVVGGGAGITGTADAMHFAYQTLVGDGSITARLTSPQLQHAGVMIRETLAPNSADAYVYYSNQAYLQYRATTGGNYGNWYASLGTATSPYWLRLVRAGNTFTGYASFDSVNWTQIGSTTIPMAQSVYVGLATSGFGSLATANFDCVSINSTSAPAPVITGTSATTGSIGSQVTITGTNFGAAQGGSVVLLNNVPMTINQWGGTSILFTIPTGATSGPLLVSVAPSMNDSNPVTFVVTSQPLPSSWLNRDVGVVGLSGSATYTGGVFTVKGAGSGAANTADAMQFVYQPLAGDGSIVARVTSLQGVNYPQVGVMIRETLNAGSTHAFVYFCSNQAYLFTRTTTGGSTASQSTSLSFSAPYWAKLVRAGNTFSGYISYDGFDWTQVGTTTTIAMASSVYIGLGVSSESTTTLETATFDGVSINSAAAPAPVISSISATTGSIGSQVAITGANFGTTQGGSGVLLNGMAMTINLWSNTSIVFTIPTGATSGQLVVAVAPTMNDSNSVAFAATSQPLPSSWMNQDVGGGGLTGSATYAGGVFTVKGSGQIEGTADQFHFVYQPLAGDGSIVARVTSSQGATYPQVGVMIRETMNVGSTDAFVYFSPNTAYLCARTTTGGSTSFQGTSYFSPATPYWVELTRVGNTFSGYVSSDGFNWTQVGTTTTIAMASNVYVGLAVSSQSTTTLETATLDGVSVNSAAAPAPVISGISATTGSVGSQVEVTGANFGTAQGGSAVLLNGIAMTINLWSDTSIVFTIPAGATSGTLVVSVAPSMNDSNPVSFAVTTQALPTPWLDRDIGAAGVAGSATYTGGVFTVKGAGQISGTADKFHFVYQPLVGDGSIVARVTSLQGVTYPQVGVMIRETLAPGSTDALVFFQPNAGDFVTRATTGASLTTQITTFYATTPYWTKLVRVGNAFTGYVSVDGTNWTQIGTPTTVAMASAAYAGLAVSSQSTATLETATFDNVSVIVGTTPFVTGVTPLVGTNGTSVTVAGSNFGSSQGSSTISFNGAVASSVTNWNGSQIVAIVPSSAPVGTGPVTVTVNSISSPNTSASQFTLIHPVITSLDPPSAAIGGILTINGSGFGTNANGFVSVNGVQAPLWYNCPEYGAYMQMCWSDTQIKVGIPQTNSGLVTVTNNGIVSNGVPFTISGPPTVTSISPSIGPFGAQVTINGSGFGATQSGSTVSFTRATAFDVVSWSDSQIIVTAPPGAVTGPIEVNVAGIIGWGPEFTVEQITNVTDSLGRQTVYTSAIKGSAWNIVQVEGPGCSSCSPRGDVQNSYDSSGNLLSTTDGNGNTVTYTYDSSGNMLSQSAQVNGQTVITSYTYNSLAEVLTMTDPLGHVTTNTYDANGNLLSVTSPAPNGQTPPSVTQFGCDTKGELTSITDPLNHPTTLTYYPTGLIQSITDAQNHTTSYGYDLRGNRTSVIDPINGSAHPTTFTFDIMNRLTGITYPDSTSVSFGYDARGRRTSATDQNNRSTVYAYDDADRLISVTDAANNLTQYAYDTENNLTSITDANNHTTYFTYDAFGRVIQTTFPSTLIETYGYDGVGNLTSKTDRKNQTIQYVYDALNRLTHKGYPDSTGVDYVYDLVGKIQQVADPTGTYGFAYDNMGRLIGTTTQYSFLPGHNFQNAYTYDAASNRTYLVAPDGSNNNYQYDTLNRLATLTNSLTGQFAFAYDALSRRTQLTRPNGINTNYNYDSVSHLLSVLHQAGSTTLDGAGYGYDYAGNRTSKTNYLNGITEGYTYDPIYELTQVVQGASTTESYSYDAVGNRLSSLGVNPYSYNTSNELTATPSGSYTYDANGNTLTDAQGRSFTWDFENRLVQAVNPGVGTTTFKYDPFGRRIYKSSPNFTGIFVYDGDDLVETVNPSGTVVSHYTQGQKIDEPLAELRSGGSSYYEADGLGSITSLSSSAGAVANTYTYDSFGNLTNFTGTLRNPFQYAGREFDSETGIYDYRHRYYDQSVGRFISEDPIKFDGGFNFYQYVQNQPINNFDPFGLTCTTQLSLVTAYCVKGNPTKSGRYPSPGTVATANTHPQPYPMGCSVSVSGPLFDPVFDPRPINPFNTPDYNGTIYDTGAGWDAKHHHVQPDTWFDIWFFSCKEARQWGLQWRKVTVCCNCQ